MAVVRKRGEEIRHFVLANVKQHPHDIVALTSQEFSISRQAVNKHIQRLVKQNSLTLARSGQKSTYALTPKHSFENAYRISSDIAEDIVWDADFKDLTAEFPDNVRDIWEYGFTEIFNNAIDHSAGTYIYVHLEKNAFDTTIFIMDNGIGIFKKITTELNLEDERQAVLELSKGKLTTDPKNHTGQGIFFSSRIFDRFSISSNGIIFSHSFGTVEDWVAGSKDLGFGEDFSGDGTMVGMEIDNNTSRTCKKIFDEFSSDLDSGYGFTKTNVPVRLAAYGNEKLVSRSQAKRVLSGLTKFKKIILDFEGVEAIGQAFSDQVFRVFSNSHPEIELIPFNTNEEVKKMIVWTLTEKRLNEQAKE